MDVRRQNSAATLMTIFKPNYIATLGAFVGLFALTFTWLNQPIPGMYPVNPIPKTADEGLQRIVGSGPFWGPVGVVQILSSWGSASALALAVFIAGTFIALSTPLGGLIQGLGLIGFAWNAPIILRTGAAGSTVFGNYSFGPGYFLAVASMLIVTYAGISHFWSRGASRFVPSQGRIAALLPRSVGLLR